MQDRVGVGDALGAVLDTAVTPPRHPCPVCKLETKQAGTFGGRVCRAGHESGSVAVRVDGVIHSVPFRSTIQMADLIDWCMLRGTALYRPVPVPPPPLSSRATGFLQSQAENERALNPCPTCGRETREGNASGERRCSSVPCGFVFGVGRVLVTGEIELVDGLVLFSSET